MKFEFTPITPEDAVIGAGDTKENPRLDAIDELQAKVEEDFDYVISGIERLVRENMLDDASSLLTTLSETLNSAVSIIGNDFDKGGE